MKLFSRKYGSGPAMILLHGLYGSSDNWVAIARLLSKKYEVHLPDQRNHGQSPHSTEHNNELMKEDLLQYMNDRGLEKAVLAGHSMGGKTIMYFARDYPERVAALIVIDILPFPYFGDPVKFSEHRAIIDSLLFLNLNNIKSREEAEQQLSGSIQQKRITGFLLKNLQRDKNNKFFWKINLHALKDHLTEIFDGFDVKQFNNVNGITGFPVLFIRGELSDYIPVDSILQIKKVFPYAETVTIPNAGHWLHAEQPELLVKNIMYFLGDYPEFD